MAVRLPSTFHLKRAMHSGSSTLVSSIEYKTGAVYDGGMSDQAKHGSGIFTWPNGDKYLGQFLNDRRNGKGEQLWSDGDSYVGEFINDVRDGNGQYVWNNGDKFFGIFYKDHKHGPGKYMWKDGSVFTGTFYLDKKEGYGILEYANGNKFEGLYRNDEREGPGVLTYKDGLQDVGLWHREHLVKLLAEVPSGFSLSNHAELHFDINANRTRLKDDENSTYHTEFLHKILNPPEDWNYDPIANARAQSRLSEALVASRPDSVAFDKENFDEKFKETIFPLNKIDDSCSGNAISQEIISNEDIDANSKSSSPTASPVTKPQSPTKSPTEKSSPDKRKSPIEKQSSSRKPSLTQSPTRKASLTQSPVSPVRKGSPIRSSKKSPVRQSKPQQRLSLADSVREETPQPLTEDDPHTFLAWNNSPSFMSMQRHIHRFKDLQIAVHFDVDSVLRGDRSSFNPGPLEVKSMNLLCAAGNGEYSVVRALLLTGELDPNVSDKFGRTPLLEAAIRWNTDIVNLLLDNGADVNRLNDEGVSALIACLIHLYPSDTFKHNVAENPPQIVVEEDTKISKRLKPKKSIASHMPSVPEHSQTVSKNSIQFQSSDVLIDPVSHTGAKYAGTLTAGKKPDFALTSSRWAVSDDEDDWSETEAGARGGRLLGDEGDLTSAISEDNVSPRSSEDFDSMDSLANYKITVPQELIKKAAASMALNKGVVSRMGMISAAASTDDAVNYEAGEGKTREIAAKLNRQRLMQETVQLLLSRGADPNSAQIPFPALFFAIKAGDVIMSRELLKKGANVHTRLGTAQLTPLHISVALPGIEGVEITRMLLESLAFPDARAKEDDTLLDPRLEEDWSRDLITDEQKGLLGGRTPLQIACVRDDDYKCAHQVVRLLLEHKANPNLLCNGQSALTLAVASGNDQAIDELLRHHANASLSLSHGVGNAICASTSIFYEHRRPIESRINLVNKLVKAGGDILQPVAIGPKRQVGTAVDYGWLMYSQDKRVAHSPYHALTPEERDAFQDRQRLLQHMANILREKAIERERIRLEIAERQGLESRGPSPKFIYTGAGAGQPNDSFLKQQEAVVRRPLFKYCYECGRTVGVRLTPCTRCKEVYFCSKSCKLRAWNARHKDECQRIGGGRGGENLDRIDSPTPATNADKVLFPRKTNVGNLMRDFSHLKLKNPMKGRSASAEGPRGMNRGTGKLPPIGSRGSKAKSAASSYSYQCVNGSYIRVDAFGRALLSSEPMPDNYSFE